MNAYLDLCERLYRDWLAGRSSPGAVAARLFTLEHAPEPYLIFGEGEPGLVFVSTNPGAGMPFQQRPDVEPDSLFHGAGTYGEAARRLGAFYAAPNAPIAPSARANIAAMRRIGALMGAQTVMQVEAVPWHSPSLPDKRAAISRLRQAEPEFRAYEGVLRQFLRDRRVVLSWAAGWPESPGDGVMLKADLIGLDLRNCACIPLERTSKVSQGLLLGGPAGATRGIFVNQGAASLPADGKNRAGLLKDDLIRTALRSALDASGAGRRGGELANTSGSASAIPSSANRIHGSMGIAPEQRPPLLLTPGRGVSASDLSLPPEIRAILLSLARLCRRVVSRVWASFQPKKQTITIRISVKEPRRRDRRRR
ncbi:MAG: hypothetical protein HY859_17865 [Caulobacterales bacterium]|nr:hypothetical protein [Caulobacterales bacterium]